MNSVRGTVRLVLRSCLLGAACLVLAGCGAGKGDLTGSVKLGDKPVRMGTVTVTAADGSQQSGVIQEDGTYKVSGIPAGDAKIAVTSPDPKTSKTHMRQKGKETEAAPPVDTSKWTAIPEKYTDTKTSGLATSIKSGENKFDIDLK